GSHFGLGLRGRGFYHLGLARHLQGATLEQAVEAAPVEGLGIGAVNRQQHLVHRHLGAGAQFGGDAPEGLLRGDGAVSAAAGAWDSAWPTVGGSSGTGDWRSSLPSGERASRMEVRKGSRAIWSLLTTARAPAGTSSTVNFSDDR